MPRRRVEKAPEHHQFPRIPFSVAIKDKHLMAKGFASMTPPQATILKIIYGLPLDADELRFWNAFNGFGVYDDLGYLVDVKGEIPYEPTEYEDITLILGRRSGKSERISSFIVTYETLFGGHKSEMTNPNQDPVFLQVAQDLITAKANLRQFIRRWIEDSPVGAAELKKRGKDAITAENIKLDMGLITVGAPTIKLRSQAVAVCAMDEVGFWHKDKEAANPDVEVEIAVRPAMAQFPYRKLIKTSTPWTEEGLLWEAAQRGTKGRLLSAGKARDAASKVLVLTAPTAAMENPAVPRSYLFQERAKDADAFRRENLAEFSKSASGFLSPTLLRAAVVPRVVQRDPKPRTIYVATMDPAFRRDAFAFTIGHLENGVFIQDFVSVARGTTEAPLSPRERMRELANYCHSFGVTIVYTDQFHLESLADLAEEEGLSIYPYLLTAKTKNQMWGDFQSMLNQGRIRLLDDPEQLEELMSMERMLTSRGTVQIYGKRDDRATVAALCVHQCLRTGEALSVEPQKEKVLSQQVRDRVVHRHHNPTAWWNA